MGNSPIESFTCALWDFKRRLRTTEPLPEDYGLTHVMGEELARRIQNEFETQKLAEVRNRGKAMAK